MCFKKVWNRRKLFRFDQLINLLKGCILNKSIPILYFALEKIAGEGDPISDLSIYDQ